MFLGAAVLVIAGDLLIERRGTEFYALGLLFAGIKLIYSSFWSLYTNFDLIDGTTFTYALIGTLAFHYGLSLRYHSEILNVSFILLSWTPLVLAHDIHGQDNLIIFIFLGIIVFNYLQAHQRCESTSIMVTPAAVAFYIYLNASGMTILDFTFALEPADTFLAAVLVVIVGLGVLLLHVHYRSATLLTPYFHDRPGTTFSQLISLLLILAALASTQMLPPFITLFILSLTFSMLIIVHFHMRGEMLHLLISSPMTGLFIGCGVLGAILVDEGFVIPFVLLATVISIIYSTSIHKLPESMVLQRRIILAFPLVLLLISVLISVNYPEILEYLPALFLLLAIGFQLFLSYSYIRNIHIITGELIFLIIAASYAIVTDDPLGYVVIWCFLLVFFSVLAYSKRDGDLAAQLLFIMSLDLLITADLCGEFISIPSVLIVISLFILVRWYTGRYFLHELLTRVNDITIILKKYRLLDLYNLALLLSLMMAVRAVLLIGTSWPVYPLAALLFYGQAHVQKRGKILLPILLFIAGMFLVYFTSLLLLSLITIFSIITLLQIYQQRNIRVDHYLQIVLFASLGLAAAVQGLEGAWLSDILGLSQFARISVIYGCYLYALIFFLHQSRHYVSIIISGMVALGELAALMVLTFEYEGSIGLYFTILFLIMSYFGIYLVDHTPQIRERSWRRDRRIILATSIILFITPLVVFNFRNDITEVHSWVLGAIGVIIILMNDILRYGLNLQRWEPGSARFLPNITTGELVAILSPTILCLNFSHNYSLWVFLIVFSSIFTLLVMRNPRSRLHLLILYGLMSFLPFNILLLVGDVNDMWIHRVSDLIPITLVILYMISYLPSEFLQRFRTSRRMFSVSPEYSWLMSTAVMLIATFSSSNYAFFFIPVIFFPFAFWKQDVMTTPSSYVAIMAVYFIYLSVLRGQDDAASNGLILFSILPLFLALLTDVLLGWRSLTFSLSTLSFMLMFGVPWFAAATGTFVSTVITNIIWSVFGGTAFSAGFYLDRRYLRYYGTFFLLGGIIITVYSTYILGMEAVVGSLIVFSFMALLASYFYILAGERERFNMMDQRR